MKSITPFLFNMMLIRTGASWDANYKTSLFDQGGVGLQILK